MDSQCSAANKLNFDALELLHLFNVTKLFSFSFFNVTWLTFFSFFVCLFHHLCCKTSQELQMLSSVTLNCQVTKIVMDSGSQL